MWRRTTVPALFAVGGAFFTVVAIASNVSGWSVAGWVVTTALASIALIAEHGPLAARLRRRDAARLLRLALKAARVLRAQGEERPEVMEQTRWHADALEATSVRLLAISEGREDITGRQWDQLYRRVIVDISPGLDQIVADHPESRRARFVAWSARREARKV